MVAMKLNNYGAFFMKMQDKSIWIVIYFKTNYLLNKKPKIPNFNEKPNTIFAVFFDKNGRDYIGNSIPLLKFKDMLKIKKETSKNTEKASQNVVEVYDYNDNTPEEMHTNMNASGMAKFYSKKWFIKQYTFIKGQIANYE